MQTAIPFSRRHNLPLVCTVFLLFTWTGCREINWTPWADKQDAAQADDARPSMTSPAPGSGAEDPARLSTEAATARPIALRSIDFLVLRVQATRGVFSESGKIWNALDEEVIPADTRAILRKNGLRIGLGEQSAWPQIKALLDAEKVKVFQNHRPVQNGLPLIIEVDPRPRDQTLFLFRPDGSMPGATFPQSTNVLRIEYWIPVTDAEAVMLELMPEIRQQRFQPRPSPGPSGWVQPPSYQPSRPLRELAARVRVGPDAFLALGPSRAAHQHHLAGSLLLCEEIDGRPFESMYFITPKVVTIGGPAPP